MTVEKNIYVTIRNKVSCKNILIISSNSLSVQYIGEHKDVLLLMLYGAALKLLVEVCFKWMDK